MQQPVGENMPALRVGGKLDFVDGQEIHRDVARHGLDRTNPIARAFGLDLFLARDQRDVARANACGNLVVHLARQQPQRQADHPAFVTKHPLDRKVRLTCIRRTQNRGDVADAGI